MSNTPTPKTTTTPVNKDDIIVTPIEVVKANMSPQQLDELITSEIQAEKGARH